MKMNGLGRTGISVSQICLGTMTYGNQNTEAEGHLQLDIALDRGVNFLDTAEMYPFPSRPETYGRTEEIIGSWMRTRANRSSVIVATKIVGPGTRFAHVRGGDAKYNRDHIVKAVNASLKRLGTDYIDLYYTHWPERPTNFFGKLGYTHDFEAEWTPFEETLSVMDDIVKQGKVRAFGVSNESAWGVAEQLKLAENTGWPRVATIQNPYSLLNRSFEVGLAEIAVRDECGLSAYSPLGFGALTGKYLDGGAEPNSRHALYPEFTRYFNARAETATRRYVALAQDQKLDPAQMALAFVNSRQFLTSNIIGARTITQLKTNLDSADLVLSPEVLHAIEVIHNEYSNPSP
ncbi:MAG: aldo/keto reductase [Rhodospirillaceae bacterium TMED8]|nr:aldo/keto reductase [Magnetovibrio sp.]OUT51219.1 MAG: aldo/keto reductase [Rhodospirillaceae bacterium TMED8]